MANCFVWCITAIFLLAKLSACATFKPPNVWENVEYKKLVEVKHAYINEEFDITIRNIAGEPQSEYFLALPDEIHEHLSILEAELANKKVFINSSLSEAKTILEGNTAIGYAVIGLPSSIAPEEKISLKIKISHTAHGSPYPHHIALKDEQYLRLKTPRLPLSAYFTKQATLFLRGSPKFKEIGSTSDDALVGQNGKEGYEFQTWNDIKPFEIESQLDVVFSHNIPLIEVLNLKRDVWISHWASTLQFEEYYEIINRSAKLKSEFARLELMQDQKNMKISHYCAVLEMNLPEEASEHYYTDLVGLVSTSRVLGDNLYIKPRYPLFGGWKYNFTIGWTNKLSKFLHKSSDESFIIAVPLLNGPTDAFYKNAAVSVFLPEGAVIDALDSSVPMTAVTIDTQKSYLDLNKGHVKITCEFENLIDANRLDQIIIRYTYPAEAAYKKPLSIAGYVFVALMSFFFLKSLNLSVDKK